VSSWSARMITSHTLKKPGRQGCIFIALSTSLHRVIVVSVQDSVKKDRWVCTGPKASCCTWGRGASFLSRGGRSRWWGQIRW
jgi:hypothetical protein